MPNIKALIACGRADCEEISNLLSSLHVDSISSDSLSDFGQLIAAEQFDLVLVRASGWSSQQIDQLAQTIATSQSHPPWVLVGTDLTPEDVEQAFRRGAFDTLPAPTSIDQVKNIFVNLKNHKTNVLDLMRKVERIAGIQLGAEKQNAIEARLSRRLRILGLSSIEDYLSFFNQNRDSELQELVSLMTTHTTEFFRESSHFDFLVDRVFPEIAKDGKPIRIWSAACSTGEEVYSLAIAWFEFAKTLAKPPRIEIIGTDIDPASLEHARKGVYQISSLRNVDPSLRDKYFELGEGPLKGLVKIVDEVYNLCRFDQMNLMSKQYTVQQADVIMLRNVLIYFKPEDVTTTVRKMKSSLKPNGYLFLGHSESILNLSSEFKSVTEAVYRPSTKDDSETLVQSLSPRANGTKPIRVLIVDDSRTIRLALRKILSADHGFQVVGEASHPLEADDLLKTIEPDLMTLDIHMPEMDGISYLSRLKSRGLSLPIVMLSSVSYEEGVNAFRCFDLGAVDFIEKPKGIDQPESAEHIRTTLRAAIKIKRRSTSTSTSTRVTTSLSYQNSAQQDLILIGASTGGPQAIQTILPLLTQETPPIVIVQHIPPAFSGPFAKRLNELSRLKCKEAQDGDILQPSCVFVAPGGKQLRIQPAGNQLRLSVNEDAPVNRHRPSVDYLFLSVAKLRPSTINVSAALLTGMGEDGARGLKSLRDWGAHTIAQDEESCIVFGMPKAAIALSGATEVLPLTSIAHHLILPFVRRQTKAA